MVEYLVNVRHGNLDAMGYVPTGFYGGAFLGRLLLAEPTFRLGERRMIFLYAVICVGLQLVFWLWVSLRFSWIRGLLLMHHVQGAEYHCRGGRNLRSRVLFWTILCRCKY